ncbi:MAG TPA: DNA-processing protein DprA [Acidobacteriota bacterium]|nr:DNA-processing protein DprA [Acidobacteriota bacterium]
MRDQAFHLMALTLVPGLGRRRLGKMLRQFPQPERILDMKRSQLREFGLSHEIRAYIVSGCPLQRAEEMAGICRERDIRVLVREDAEYPELLRQIHDPPLLLYVKGRIECLSRPSLAVVGARSASVYGLQVTTWLARELALSGLAIVSGLARGVDARAHQGALEAGGDTIAVLGNGLDIAYPRENRRLQERIGSEGCLVSEFPCGTNPAPSNFPVRNRIISGLSLGVLITQADRRSGSLITARMALEQDREVWAVPGNITDKKCLGSNDLIRQGAVPVLEDADVLECLHPNVLQQLKGRLQEQARPDEPAADGAGSPDVSADAPPNGASRESAGAEDSSPPPDSSQGRLLREMSFDQASHFDNLLQRTGLSASRLNELLLALEMDGYVESYPGRRYSRRL